MERATGDEGACRGTSTSNPQTRGGFLEEVTPALMRRNKKRPAPWAAHLEDADEGLREAVEVAAAHLGVLEVIPAPEELHAQQGEDDDEEEEQEQQRGDGADGVEQGRHQVAQRRPVPAGGGREVERWPSPQVFVNWKTPDRGRRPARRLTW